jgi:hypothetical protein
LKIFGKYIESITKPVLQPIAVEKGFRMGSELVGVLPKPAGWQEGVGEL